MDEVYPACYSRKERSKMLLLQELFQKKGVDVQRWCCGLGETGSRELHE